MIFGALPMQRVVLHLLREDMERASLALADAGVLDPEPVDTGAGLDELPGEGYAAVYSATRVRFDKIVRFLGLDREPAGDELQVVSRGALQDLDDALVPAWHECTRWDERQRRVNERRLHLQQQRSGLETFARLDVDLGLLQGDHEFLDVRVGTLDYSQLERLREALGLIGHSVLEFHREGDTSQVVIVGLQGNGQELPPVLKAAGFHPLELNLELTGHPDELRGELEARAAALDRELADIDEALAELRERHRPLLAAAAHKLRCAAPFAALGGSMRGKGGLVRLEGWVPARDVARLRERLGASIEAFHLESRPPRPDELGRVPSVQHYPAWVRPFADLVHGYGTPRYDEFDPTWLFAVTFTLMFGMMFGDVGHGLVIVIAAWALRRKLRQFTWFGIAAGLSSTVFGFLYGSIFGYEGVLIHPVWMSPLSDPMHLLMLALYWGIGFILLATALSAWNLWRRGDRRRALLGVKGIAGLLFYLAALFVLSRMARGAEMGFLDALLMLVPLGAILAEVWRETPARGGERALVTFMEGFEAVMGYVSNTLSFLRVAAFSLNHAALAIAVMTLAGMLGTFGHWMAVVIGNVIILVLEGGIVLIQVLRLEYYEGFARFFGGDGRAYRPLTLQTAGGRSNR